MALALASHFYGALALAACGGSGSTTSSLPSATPSGDASSGVSQQHGLVWKFKTGAAVRSSPAVSNGVVYVGSDDGYLYAVDVQSGQQRWAFKTGGKVRGSLAVAGGAVYFRSGDGILYAVDVQSGQRRWAFAPSLPVVSSPAVADGAVYVATSKGQPRPAPRRRRLSLRAGQPQRPAEMEAQTGLASPRAPSARPPRPPPAGWSISAGSASRPSTPRPGRSDGRCTHPFGAFRATPAVSTGWSTSA